MTGSKDIAPDVRTALAVTRLTDESRALALINRYESRYSRQSIEP